MAMIYCYECGKKVSDKAECCPNCGAVRKCAATCENRKAWAALLLAWLLGVFGAHRFYVGKTGTAVAMLVISLTFFGLIITSIWTLIDMIVIICGNFTDSTGKKLKF